MSVFGVAINVGQKWLTRGGKTVTVVTRVQHPIHYPWSVAEQHGAMTSRYSVSEDGYLAEGTCSSGDLVQLLSVRDALTETELPVQMFDDPNVKATNPKDAIGDRKVPLWLCSAIAMAHWAAAQFAGLIKYGAWNWRAAGVRTSTYLSAIARHWTRYANGERCDPIDGTHHLGNIMACCAILLEAEAIGKLNDDRSPRADLQPVFDEVEAMMMRLKELYADKAPKHWTINDEVQP